VLHAPAGVRAVARFLDLLDEAPEGVRPELDALGLSFQLKLLWLSGYLPHVGSCAECGSAGPLCGYSARAGGTVCTSCSAGALALSADGLAGMDGLLRSPLADARTAGLTERGAREVLSVITSSYEEHGGFRLRTLRAG
jgi:DNA repair protein RecO (recombination protein O)